MAKTGPKVKPTELKILEGNPGKRALPGNEPKPAAAMPDCPSFLKGAARREWKRITPELYLLGLLTRIDRAALAGYCQAYGRWEEAERLMSGANKAGLKTKRGNKGKKSKSCEAGDKQGSSKDGKPSVDKQGSAAEQYSGWLFMTSKGNLIISPVLSIANKAMEQMHSFLTEFGMTPASRGRIQVDKVKGDEDPIGEFLDHGQRKN